MADKFANIGYGEQVDATNALDAELGIEFVREDIEDPRAKTKVLLSGRPVCCRVMRNGDSATLAAGQVVKRKDTSRLTDVVACGAGDEPEGIVDPFLTAALAELGACAIIFMGPTKVQKAAGSMTEGQGLHTAASGRVSSASEATYIEDPSFVGELLETSDAAAGTLVRTLANCQPR